MELDRRDADETPRVTIRGIRPFDGMSMATTRLKLDVTVDAPGAADALAAILSEKRGGRGELHLFATMPDGRHAHLLAGRDYSFDAELVARIEKLPGIGSARLGPIEAPRLALVG